MQDEEIQFLEESNLIEGVGMEGLDDSVLAWEYAKEQKSIGLFELSNIHKLLMQNLNPRIAGKFRDVAVTVGNRLCPQPGIALQLVSDLLDFKFNEKQIKKSKKQKKDWVEMCRKDHIWFETQHPFEDGNGRTGRILLNWQRLQYGLPILIIKNSEKQEYYKWFAEPTINLWKNN